MFAHLSQDLRVSRSRRALFPLPRPVTEDLKGSLGYRVEMVFSGETFLEDDLAYSCWMELATMFLNRLHEGKWVWSKESATKPQSEMLKEIQKGVKRILSEDVDVNYGVAEIREDLSKKMVSYTGEEISCPEVLTAMQVEPGLPPENHGGQIPVLDWVSGRCRWMMEHPVECLVDDEGQQLPPMQAKMHIAEEDQVPFASLLVKKNICKWIHEDKVLRYRNQLVLSGLFGVRKPKKFLSDQRPVLRLIMNLIPTNAIHRVITGKVHQLPHITRWMSTYMGENDLLQVCQSDMASAFYLFSIPPQWYGHLAFNLQVRGRDKHDTSGLIFQKSYFSKTTIAIYNHHIET